MASRALTTGAILMISGRVPMTVTIRLMGRGGRVTAAAIKDSPEAMKVEIIITALPLRAALLVSVVTTVRNEARNIAALLDSLAVQEPPIEVIVVDSHSEDATRDIVRMYEKRYDFVHLYVSGGTRGAGRNFGIRKARGEAVAFIDGDAIANPFWIRELREGLRHHDIVAGRTIQIGYRPFEELERVELIVQGPDVTYPSSNLAYRKAVLNEIGGFDEWFVTAEDIDLNIRAVRAGHPIVLRADAIVYTGRATRCTASCDKRSRTAAGESHSQ